MVYEAKDVFHKMHLFILRKSLFHNYYIMVSQIAYSRYIAILKTLFVDVSYLTDKVKEESSKDL